ncbi:MAG: S1C family serine protease [Pirellulales bacterium]
MSVSDVIKDRAMGASMTRRRRKNFAQSVCIALVAAFAYFTATTACADGTNEKDSVFAEALAYAQPRCVKLYGAGTNVEAGYATGLIVSDDGLILTAQGIYLAGDRLRAVLADGSTYDTTLVRRSEPLQAALLKIDAKTPNYFPLAKEPIGEKGDWVLAVSNLFKVAANKEWLSANLGVISLRTRVDARHRTQDVPYDAEMLLVDAITSNPGASGGAVIDMDGRLVGMIGKLLESKNTNTRINYAVPADLLYKFVRNEPIEVAESPPASAGDGKASLGLRMFTVGGMRSPAYVDRIVPGSPAAKLGMKRDDLIMQIDGETVKDLRDYERIFATLRPGVEITIIVKRKRDVLSLQITPEAEK